MIIEFITILLFINRDKSDGLRELDCGRQSIKLNLDDRIIAGTIAEPNSWPWIVSLYGLGPDFTYLCGGSIISSEWILSAAHCFIPSSLLGKPEVWNIRVSEVYYNILTDSTLIVKADKIVKHEHYYYPLKLNDIAVIKLKTPLKFGEKIQPICLPPKDYSPPNYMKCYVAGWPHELQDKGYQLAEDQPRNQMLLPIIPHKTCTKPEYYGAAVTETMLCAGWKGGRQDTTKGDSGLPLMCLVNEKWTAVGIVSWGDRRLFTVMPTVFTKVSSFIEWIQEHTKE